MPDLYQYYHGRCTICGNETEVRHKADIWLIGSEGTDMCWPCEKGMLEYLREQMRYYTLKKKDEYRKKKKNRTKHV